MGALYIIKAASVCVCVCRQFVLLLCVLSALFLNAVADNYTTRIPSSFSLAGGTTRADNATARCNTYECNFNYGGNGGISFSYSTTGTSNSTLNITSVLPTITQTPQDGTGVKFYLYNTYINPNSTLNLSGFNSILLEGNLSLNGATMSFTSTTGTSRAGSFQIGTRSSLLLNNSSLTITMGQGGFINQNQTTLNNATLTISGLNLQNTGTMVVNSGSTLTMNSNRFENLGGRASFTNNGGTITITGNFVNGGTNQGGLIASGSGSMSLNGGNLTATSVNNSTSGTITFGAYNGTMGKITGNLANNGVVVINMSGASAGTYQLVTGNVSGTALNAAMIINGNSAFATTTLQGNSVTLVLNQNATDDYKNSISGNIATTIDALGDNIWTTSGMNRDSATQAAKNINDNALNAHILTPFSLINALKATTSATLNYKDLIPARTANLALLANGIAGGGSMLGANLSLYYSLPRIKFAINAAYTTANISSTSSNIILSQKNTLQSTNYAITATMQRQLDNALILDTSAYIFMINGSIKRDISSSVNGLTQGLDSSFNAYHLGFDANIGTDMARDIEKSIVPYIGLSQSISIMPSVAESAGSLSLERKAYNSYNLAIALGARFFYTIARDSEFVAKIHYEYLALSTAKANMHYASGGALNFSTKPYTHSLNLKAGYKKHFRQLSIGADVSLSTSMNEMAQNRYFYGLQGFVGYEF